MLVYSVNVDENLRMIADNVCIFSECRCKPLVLVCAFDVIDLNTLYLGLWIYCLEMTCLFFVS